MFRTLRTLARSVAKSSNKPSRFFKRTCIGLENLEDRAVPATLVFQDGNNPTDYRGTEDTVLYSPSPDTEFYTDSGISVDQQDANGVRQGLLQFRNIYTSSGEAGKIPLGSTINSASIRFSTFNDSNSEAQISLYRMLIDWREGKPIPASVSSVTSTGTTATVTTGVPHTFELGESVTLTGVSVSGYNGTFAVASVLSNTSFTYTLPAPVAGAGFGGTSVNNTPPATWNLFRGAGRPIGGVQASEGESQALPDYVHFDPSAPTIQFFDVSRSLQAWSGGQPNFGWLFESGSTNGWDFDTSENSLANRPKLTVDFTPPATVGAASTGAFRLTSVNPVSKPEGNSGTTTYTVQVSRIGGSVDAVSVDYTVTAGTATADDFTPIATTTLNFGAGVTSGSFDITIAGDDLLEGLETINIALSNPQNVTNPGVNTPTITSGLGAATLTIADDDALINEVFANTTDAATEQNRTYIELIGTPGASLAGYQFVVFESEEEENSGTGSGRADLVIDLGTINGGAPATFGSSGILVITPTAWAYTAVAGTNVYTTTALDGVDGGLEDFSQTYALIRRGLNGSGSPIVQGTDYDTLGYGANIASITSDGVTATVTTTTPHLFITGNTATIGGTGNAGFDGPRVVTLVGTRGTSTTFTFPTTAPNGTAVATGNAHLPGYETSDATFVAQVRVGVRIGADGSTVQEGVGILDQLPANIQFVDHVYITEGGSGNRDRSASPAAIGLPGVHIHQPTGNNSDTAPDAVTRRAGDRTPNSTGPWYNGEIPNATTLAYDTTGGRANVTTPVGGSLTPGEANILRTISAAVVAPHTLGIDEPAAGTSDVTVRFTRSDTSQAINVAYSVGGGTAVAATDYGTAAPAGPLFFDVGVAFVDIVIPINSDTDAEGPETFNVSIGALTYSPAQTTAPFLAVGGPAIVTINDGDVSVAVFRNDPLGLGYQGTKDVVLNGLEPDLPFGLTGVISVDEAIGDGIENGIRGSQSLIKFEDLFGGAVGQVPTGSRIFGGFLTLNVSNASTPQSDIRLFRMLQNWHEESSTWADVQGNLGNGIVNGVTPDGVEASVEPDRGGIGSLAGGKVTTPGVLGQVVIPINADTLQAWANGVAPNFGWMIVSDTDNDWSFGSKDNFDDALWPSLTLLYTPPALPVIGDVGRFRFSEAGYSVNENGSINITVERVGGVSNLTSDVTVNWTLAPNASPAGAVAGDISTPLSGSVIFTAAGDQLFQTFAVTPNNDSDLEANETFALSLPAASNPGLTIDRSSATLTVRDNDLTFANTQLLINEVFINAPGNDGGSEFFELKGLTGVAMGSLYLVVIEGDVGPYAGSTDLVEDLGNDFNGTSGYTVIGAATNFDHRVPTGTTMVGRADLSVENLANDTGTYALLYSPMGNFPLSAFNFDWNRDGVLELPPGVQFIDTVAIKDTGTSDITYGPPGGSATAADITIDTTETTNGYIPDAISRKRNNNTPNAVAAGATGAFFSGDLTANGDDSIVYLSPNFDWLPAGVGTAMTPGEINTGDAIESPLVKLVSATINPTTRQFTLTFNGMISQNADAGAISGVQLTAVPGGSGIATGNMSITGLGTSTLIATVPGAGSLPVGNYTLTFRGDSLVANGRAVDTNGDNAFTTAGDNAATQSFTVSPAAPTTTALVANPNATTGGTLVTFTATVSPSPGALGTVTFRDNGVALPGDSNVALDGGVATFQISTLSAGVHPITAVYSGATGFLTSTSAILDFTVTAAPTTTTLSVGAPNPATPTEAISFTVTVAGGASTDGESVVLKNASDGNAIVTTTGGVLSGGSATIVVTAGALSVGTHNLFAEYAGNAFNDDSQSTQVSQTITSPAAPPVVVATSVNGGAAYTAFAGAQRSRVVSLSVTFDQPVQIDTGAFGLGVHTNNMGLGSVPTNILSSSPDGGTTWILSFDGNTDPTGTPPTDGFQSLKDGVYDFTIDAAKVHPLGFPSVNAVSGSSTVFHRLFGDSTGEELPVVGNAHVTVVAVDDNFSFRSSFANAANYNAGFDFDGDGVIGVADNFQFRSRFNRPLTWNV